MITVIHQIAVSALRFRIYQTFLPLREVKKKQCQQCDAYEPLTTALGRCGIPNKHGNFKVVFGNQECEL